MKLLDPFRWLMSATLGTRWVTLIDAEYLGGARHIRRIWFDWNGKPKATRVGFGIRHVTLLDGGHIDDGSYCKRWEPYIPFNLARSAIARTEPTLPADRKE